MANDVVLTFEEGDVTFTLEQMPAEPGYPQAFALRVEGHEFGAVIHQSGNICQVRPVAPAMWFNDRRWRRTFRGEMTLEQAAHRAAKHVLALVERMRFDDPTVAGDPAEEKLPGVLRDKLTYLRAALAGARQAKDELEAKMYGPVVTDSGAQVALLHDGKARPMPPGATVRFVVPSGALHVRVRDDVLAVTAQDGTIVVVPLYANCVALSVRDA